MQKLIAMLAVLQLGLVFSPVVRADDVKPAAAPANQMAPAQSDSKEVKADKECDAKTCDGKSCDGKSCDGKKAKKSCKHCKHCKMHHHGSKKGSDDGSKENEGELEGSTHH